MRQNPRQRSGHQPGPQSLAPLPRPSGRGLIEAPAPPPPAPRPTPQALPRGLGALPSMTSSSADERAADLARAEAAAFEALDEYEALDASVDTARTDAERAAAAKRAAAALARAEAGFLECFAEHACASRDLERAADDDRAAAAKRTIDEAAAGDLADIVAFLERVKEREARDPGLLRREAEAAGPEGLVAFLKEAREKMDVWTPAHDGYLSSVWIDQSFNARLFAEAREPAWLRRLRNARKGRGPREELVEVLAELWGGQHGPLRRERALYQARFEARKQPIDEAGARRLVALLAEADAAGLILPNCPIEISLERVQADAYDAELHAKRLDAEFKRVVADGWPAPLELEEWPAKSREFLNRNPRAREKGTPRRRRRSTNVRRNAFVVVALAALKACGRNPQRSSARDVKSGADIVADQLNTKRGVFMMYDGVEKVWTRARREGHFVLS